MVGVSKTTISFYLNGKTNKMSDETQKKIQQVIEETGYTPSAATRTVKASDDCIGVILGDVSKPFAAKALKGIEEEAHEAGYQVIVGNNEMSFAKEKEYVEHNAENGCIWIYYTGNLQIWDSGDGTGKENKRSYIWIFHLMIHRE